MGNETQQFGQIARSALTAVATSPRQSTSDTNSSEAAHKRAFLDTFRRWELLFKRKEGASVEAEMWLIAEYYDSLRHLSIDGFKALTEQLKKHCTFFPTIRECLEMTRPKDRYDYAHPFRRKPGLIRADHQPALGYSAPRQIEDHSE